ncbi:hypothetical protein ATANTOWER_001932 [Ataeniobius toweri]|uniref:Uncharacterized protein n=1 Tax=Ataeniobius toweri TaxID=208326 RepID=A0ABU7CH51_9TELE|nr:hypothetical protein [Ataeniobius toweri]
MPEAPELTPLDVEEQWLYSEPLPDGRAPHPISKGVPGHPAREAHFSHLYPGSCSFSHDPKFMLIGEGKNVDRPLNQDLNFSAQLCLHHNGLAQLHHYCGGHSNESVDLPLHCEQDPELLELLQLRQELSSNLKRASHPFSSREP